MLSNKGLVRLAIIAALLIASVARADESAVSGTKVAPELGGERQLGITAWGGTNKVRVDGEDSQKIGYRSFGAQLHYAPKIFLLDLAGTSLERDIDEIRMNGKTSKSTKIVTPALGIRVTPSVTAQFAYSDIRTQVDNDLVADPYELDTHREALSVAWKGDGQRLAVTFSTAARAEKDYIVGSIALTGYEFPMTDRDYAPAQLDVAYARQVLQPLEVTGKVRYSQYDNDVYKDSYDTDVPKTPTVGQVFDYLLSFDVGATYAVTSNVGLIAAFERKAALDTNSYTGDEYLVGNGATIATRLRLSDFASAAASATASTGAKTHKVDGQSYDYANRLSRFEASLALSM